MKEPLVVVSIPTYNQEKYIVKAVNSVLAQTYQNLKINISDDCSTDGTFRLCNEYYKNIPNISIFQNRNNMGRVINYQKLFYDYAREAEWVINLDGDDWFTDPNFIDRSMKEIEDNNKYDRIVLYHSQLDIRPFKKKKLKKINSNSLLIYGKDYFIDRPLLSSWSHFSAIIRRSAAIQLPFYKFDSLNTDALSIRLLSLEGYVIINNQNVGTWNFNEFSESNKSTTITEIERCKANEALFLSLSKEKLTDDDLIQFDRNIMVSNHFVFITNNLKVTNILNILKIYVSNRQLRKYYTRSILYHLKIKLKNGFKVN